MIKRRVETAIQKELVKWLNIEHPTLEFYYYKAEGEKSMVEAVEDKRMGLKAGFPDLFFFKDIDDITYVFHLELKKLKGFMHNSQKEWHSNFKTTKNRSATTARGLQAAQEAILHWLQKINEKK